MIWNLREISGVTQWTATMGTLQFLIQQDKPGYALKVRYAGDERYTHVGLYASFYGAKMAAEGKDEAVG